MSLQKMYFLFFLRSPEAVGKFSFRASATGNGPAARRSGRFSARPQRGAKISIFEKFSTRRGAWIGLPKMYFLIFLISPETVGKFSFRVSARDKGPAARRSGRFSARVQFGA